MGSGAHAGPRWVEALKITAETDLLLLLCQVATDGEGKRRVGPKLCGLRVAIPQGDYLTVAVFQSVPFSPSIPRTGGWWASFPYGIQIQFGPFRAHRQTFHSSFHRDGTLVKLARRNPCALLWTSVNQGLGVVLPLLAFESKDLTCPFLLAHLSHQAKAVEGAEKSIHLGSTPRNKGLRSHHGLAGH
ncbi:hypothetical protein JRQ81_009187 [Phrynocephalus forsythii]|uniref:Uncharacterized protein n=1 Tax=Phrynocephalus forsythii TaxID=171643 RepID=A0A9Q0XBA6_9SAUR|nr:hypothetical protein JRQ81_009187 [Phrynocephalus forsythii]